VIEGALSFHSEANFTCHVSMKLLSSKQRCPPMGGRRRRASKKPLHPGFSGVISGRRYYNPSSGRWLSRDPIGEPDFDQRFRKHHKRGPSVNLYAFVNNSPVNHLDPLGLETFPNGVPIPGASTECEKALTAATAMFGNIENDARAHCLASCTIAKACGKTMCRCLGNLKEARDLTAGGIEWVCSWVLPKAAQDWLHDSIQGGNIDDSAHDFEANEYGISVAKAGKDCVTTCEARYGTEPP
jgi:RHS repeat-associated protein